jgi:hypothetical protein
LCGSWRRRNPSGAIIDDPQQVAGEDQHLPGLDRVVNYDSPMAAWVFVGADGAREQVSKRLALTLRQAHIGERSIVGVKGGSHKVRADHAGVEAARFPHRHLDVFEGLENRGVVIAPDEIGPCALGDNFASGSGEGMARCILASRG